MWNNTSNLFAINGDIQMHIGCKMLIGNGPIVPAAIVPAATDVYVYVCLCVCVCVCVCLCVFNTPIFVY